jgi:hypothetical protein
MTRHRDDGLAWYDTVVVNCRIPRQLHDEIKLLMLDPVTGQMPPRGWSSVIERGMRAWLSQQQVAPHD